VEYFLKEKFEGLNLDQYKEFIHFGLTSQDINNTAVPLSLKDSMESTYFPLLDELTMKLEALLQSGMKSRCLQGHTGNLHLRQAWQRVKGVH